MVAERLAARRSRRIRRGGLRLGRGRITWLFQPTGRGPFCTGTSRRLRSGWSRERGCGVGVGVCWCIRGVSCHHGVPSHGNAFLRTVKHV
ncbi:hypothetical protein RBSH_06050 [Rhodopirellula baltica SH28]|uniref:Uncharacterized protein n=1 Tax=Rhodopirellula baltica SH28 TaxID=993517 RepID=K5CWW1_RHOBT|nr:hypothetical protein RBSH_06050 [Rhodopirellula baltica SH28]